MGNATLGLHVELRPDEVLDTLYAATDRPLPWPYRVFRYGASVFCAEVSQETFRLYRRWFLGTPLSPVLEGRVEAEGDGSRLTGRFRMRFEGKAFVGMWLALWFAFATALWAAEWRVTEAPCLIGALAVVLTAQGLVGMLLATGDRQAIRTFLQSLFADAAMTTAGPPDWDRPS
ncbi:MAG: hypothetical protein AMS14_05465 [Planctomycetes bacterium DG_20]|nr:MAG: hypothetical protein AMS14_05465 [Planctomycetes bacterium DG_20]